MQKVTVSIDGMMCTMCEAHISEAIRKAVPGAKKVSASHTKKTAEFFVEEPVAEETVRKAIADTGYDYRGMRSEPYEKKGLFSFFK